MGEERTVPQPVLQDAVKALSYVYKKHEPDIFNQEYLRHGKNIILAGFNPIDILAVFVDYTQYPLLYWKISEPHWFPKIEKHPYRGHWGKHSSKGRHGYPPTIKEILNLLQRLEPDGFESEDKTKERVKKTYSLLERQINDAMRRHGVSSLKSIGSLEPFKVVKNLKYVTPEWVLILEAKLKTK